MTIIILFVFNDVTIPTYVVSRVFKAVAQALIGKICEKMITQPKK